MDQNTLSKEATFLHAELCSALADTSRIMILYTLNDHQLNVTELADLIEIPQSTASRHLKILRERGLVRPIRQGTSVVYHITDPRLIDALDLLRSVLHDRAHYRATILESQEIS